MKQILLQSLHTYAPDDPALKEKVSLSFRIADKKGRVYTKKVNLTEAEKRVIEALSMRLFIEHKKVVREEKSDSGRVALIGSVVIEK